jgi:hypothetical protein
MAQPLSELKKGIKFESTGSTAKLENLKLAFAAGAAQTDLLATASGGLLMTINPAAQATATTVMLVEGKYLDVSLEFNGAGQFRVRVQPTGDITTVSEWMAERTEHNVGISYSTTEGLLKLAIDGVSTTTGASFGASDTVANLSIADAGNNAAQEEGIFDGFIDQLAIFKTDLTYQQLEKLTGNPALLQSNFTVLDAPTGVLSWTTAGVAEVQTVTLTTQNASTVGNATLLGLSVPVAVGQSETLIATNLAAAFTAAARPSNVASVTSAAGVLTITYKDTVGNVVPQATVTTTAAGVAVTSAVETTPGVWGTRQGVLTFGGTYKAGDQITLTAGLAAAGIATESSVESKTYTVTAGDIKVTNAETQKAVAASVFAFLTPNGQASAQLGSFSLGSVAPTTNTLTLTANTNRGALTVTSGVLVDPYVSNYINADGVIESNVLDYFDFSKITTSASSLTGAGAGTASFFNGVITANAAAAFSLTSQDYVAAASNSNNASSSNPNNGAIYARLKSYTLVNAVPQVKYEFFVNQQPDITGAVSSLGFSLDFDEAKATFVEFVAGSGATLKEVNTADRGNGKVVYQWASTAGQTDFSQAVGELTVNLVDVDATAAVAYSTTVPMLLTNISVNNTFYKAPSSTQPLVLDAKLDTERYMATGSIFQSFTNPSSTKSTYGQGGTVFSYEVFGAQVGPVVHLDVKDFANQPTTRAQPNASVLVDVVASQGLAVGTYSMTINLPSNASGVTFTPATGLTVTSSLKGSQLTLSGTAAVAANANLGTVALTLVGQHGKGSDFSFSDVLVNNVVSVGRSMYFGIAETTATTGAFTLSNLPKGDLVTAVYDNPVAPSAKITVEDAVAALQIASLKTNAGNNWSRSDLIAADWDKNGVVNAADALGILKYAVAVDKSTVRLDYVYIDKVPNDTTITAANQAAAVSSVSIPTIAKISTHKPTDATLAPYAFGLGHTDVDLVGILVGDLVYSA